MYDYGDYICLLILQADDAVLVPSSGYLKCSGHRAVSAQIGNFIQIVTVVGFFWQQLFYSETTVTQLENSLDICEKNSK